MAIGTNGNDNITLVTSPATIAGLGGSDSLTSAVAGVPFISSAQDGGAGFDTLTADLTAFSAAGVASISNAQAGGEGSDTISATLSAYGAMDAYATSLIQDRGSAGYVSSFVDATANLYAPSGAEATNLIETGLGGDTIQVFALADGAATNIITAGRGDDTINAVAEITGLYNAQAASNDIIAGSGDDFVTVASIKGAQIGDGNIRVDAGGGKDIVDAMIGGGGAVMGDARIELIGGGNNDEMRATVNSAGAIGGSSVVLINGGSGSDTLEATVTLDADFGASEVTMLGEGGSDVMTASSSVLAQPMAANGRHVMDGGAGSDILKSVIDLYGASSGAYSAANAQAELFGGFGADRLDSAISVQGYGAVAPAVYASNLLEGSGGNDTLCATTAVGPYGAPSATLVNRLDGGNNNDLLRSEFVGTPEGVHDLNGGAGNDVIGAIAGFDAVILGGGGQDTITSSALTNTIDGGDGDDVIDADGAGVHVLTGGLGDDTFHVDLSSNNGLIELTDFDRTAEFLCFEGVTDGDVLANGTLADEINALIVGFGNNGVDYTLQFASGTVLTFDGVSPTGADDDIASYVDDDVAQLLACTDLADPIC